MAGRHGVRVEEGADRRAGWGRGGGRGGRLNGKPVWGNGKWYAVKTAKSACARA
jgi:hypothetical protein